MAAERTVYLLYVASLKSTDDKNKEAVYGPYGPDPFSEEELSPSVAKKTADDKTKEAKGKRIYCVRKVTTITEVYHESVVTMPVAKGRDRLIKFNQFEEEK